MFTRKLVLFALTALFCASIAPSMVAAQQTEPERAVSKFVKFENKTIDVAKDWGDAQACLIWDQADATECFRTEKELDSKVAAIKASNPQAYASCSDGLWLHEHAYWEGRVLKFYDRGYWQNLSTWNFSNQLSSYSVGACNSIFADYSNGGGSFYPGNTSAGYYSSHVYAGWNDRVSSIKIY